MPQEDISNIRLRNVLSLHQEFNEQMVAMGASTTGLEQAFAQKIQVSASLWSQIKSGRSVGNKLARQIESAAGRPANWLDELHPESAPDPSEMKFLAMCKAAWQRANKEERQKLKEAVRAVSRPKTV
jgi:hypothetical protein